MLNCRPGLHTRTFSDKNGLILDDLGEILGLKGGGESQIFTPVLGCNNN